MTPSPCFLDDTPALGGERAVVIGNFDGVHRGHQALIRHAASLARSRSLPLAVLTFDPHPARVLRGETRPVLTRLARKAELLAELGAAPTYVRKFDPVFAETPPGDFARTLLVSQLGAKLVLVGENFRFGAKRAGDVADLIAYGHEFGFDACPIGLAADETGAFSSSRVRNALEAGDLSVARSLLGRPHAISGTVVAGARRGRTLGFPTANIEGIEEVLPPHGVYAVRVYGAAGVNAAGLSAEGVGGVMNIGRRPTVEDSGTPTVEVHLLDWTGDLYGSTLRIDLWDRIRDEVKFPSVDALRARIASDVEAARTLFARQVAQ
jgi:riboflavin kinase/FMN adenylyltransferase